MKRSPEDSSIPAPTAALGHSYEARIRRDLMAHPDLLFSSLVVHRTPDGVCLEGVVSATADDVDVCQTVRKVAGVNAMLSHLVLCPQAATAKKG